MSPDQVQPPNWMGELTERENAEIVFCKLYASKFAHGTTGHNQMIIIAKLANMLDRAEVAERERLQAEGK